MSLLQKMATPIMPQRWLNNIAASVRLKVSTGCLSMPLIDIRRKSYLTTCCHCYDTVIAPNKSGRSNLLLIYRVINVAWGIHFYGRLCRPEWHKERDVCCESCGM